MCEGGGGGGGGGGVERTRDDASVPKQHKNVTPRTETNKQVHIHAYCTYLVEMLAENLVVVRPHGVAADLAVRIVEAGPDAFVQHLPIFLGEGEEELLGEVHGRQVTLGLLHALNGGDSRQKLVPFSCTHVSVSQHTLAKHAATAIYFRNPSHAHAIESPQGIYPIMQIPQGQRVMIELWSQAWTEREGCEAKDEVFGM